MKSKQEIQLEAVKAILSGELLLEEAMEKYNVKDKRTMTAWVKKTMPFLQASQASSPPKRDASVHAPAHAPQEHQYETEYQHITRENELLKKIITLQDQVRELKDKNMLLTRHRDLLLKKVSALESRVQNESSL